jgi:predicted dehydrogenase
LIRRIAYPDGAGLKAAVIGAGAFGRHHATKYAGLPGVVLTAIADPNPMVRRQFHMGQGVPAVADWRGLLGKVDLVSVCSPAITHAEIVRAFLERGTHVLVEKPIATDLDEADELIALAEDQGLVLTVGHQERFVVAPTGLLEGRHLPNEIACWRYGPWTGRGADVSVVLDLMIHDLDIAHCLVPGEVSQVSARGRAVHNGHADEARARLDFACGTRVRLDASRVAGGRSRGMRLVYDEGEIEIDFLTRKVRNTTPQNLAPPSFDDPLGASVRAFVEAVRGSGGVVVTPEQARLALETALVIEGQAAAGLQAQESYARRAAAG